MKLNSENYSKGFLIDEDLMGGVTENSAKPGEFTAFVIRHTTGEYVGHQICSGLSEALQLIDQVERSWQYEASSGCGGGNCDKGNCQGKCSSGVCPI